MYSVIMKNFFKAVVVIATLSLSSCATLPNVASLYTDVTEPVTATSNVVGTKVGKASATNVLGIVAMGNASINAAAKDGGITKISHVDIKKFSLLGLFSTITTFVYGE